MTRLAGVSRNHVSRAVLPHLAHNEGGKVRSGAVACLALLVEHGASSGQAAQWSLDSAGLTGPRYVQSSLAARPSQRSEIHSTEPQLHTRPGGVHARGFSSVAPVWLTTLVERARRGTDNSVARFFWDRGRLGWGRTTLAWPGGLMPHAYVGFWGGKGEGGKGMGPLGSCLGGGLV